MTAAEEPENPLVRPVSCATLPWEEWSENERFGSRFQRLNPPGITRHIGVLIEELAPGRQSCPLHYHLLEEEHVLILEGSVTLRLKDERHLMREGDYICFPAGQKAGHAFINEGTTCCRYLVIGENSPNDVAIYPDSDKVMVRNLGAVFLRSRTVDYWHGEGPKALPGAQPDSKTEPPADAKEGAASPHPADPTAMG